MTSRFEYDQLAKAQKDAIENYDNTDKENLRAQERAIYALDVATDNVGLRSMADLKQTHEERARRKKEHVEKAVRRMQEDYTSTTKYMLKALDVAVNLGVAGFSVYAGCQGAPQGGQETSLSNIAQALSNTATKPTSALVDWEQGQLDADMTGERSKQDLAMKDLDKENGAKSDINQKITKTSEQRRSGDANHHQAIEVMTR